MPRPIPILLFLLLCCCRTATAQLRADFSLDKTGGCSPLLVSFTNRTINASANATYQWDLGNGNTASGRDAQAIYTDEASYTVTLTVRDGSLTSTSSRTVTVYGHPTPTFSTSPAIVCGPLPVTFTGNAQSGGGTITNWLWDFGDGSTQQYGGSTVQHVYPATTSVTASLTVTNSYGCTNTVTGPVQVKVLTPATAVFTSDKRVLCLVTDPVQFTNSSSGPGPLTYAWDFGDGTTSTQLNPGHSYTKNGIYTVKLTTTTSEGCTATSTQSDYLNVASYTSDFDISGTTICQNTYATFTEKSTPYADSRVWTVDGSPVAYYSPMTNTFYTPGQHTVTLSNVFGNCPASKTRTITVNPAPAVVPFDQTITPTCSGINVAFVDKTSGATAWNWNFNYFVGNTSVNSPTASTGQTFSYNQSYSVRLTVTNANGCVASTLGQVYVAKPAVAIYEPNPAPQSSCAVPLTKTFAIRNQDQLAAFHWEFGDGTTSTAPSPAHTFSEPGTYNTMLYYTDQTGCSGSTNFITTIIGRPFTVDFTGSPTTTCAGSPVTFTSSSPNASPPTSYTWSYGDGYSAANNSHTYTTGGTYTVTLYAQNAGGCTASVSKTNYITVLATTFTPGGHTSTCNGDRTEVTFNYSPGSSTSVRWDFGDGLSTTVNGSVTQVIHSYARTGTYYPSMTATNGQCSAAYSDNVKVLKKQQPVLSAADNAVCGDGTLNVSLAAERNPMQEGYNGYYDYAPTFSYGDGTPFTGSVAFTNGTQPYSNGAYHWTLSGFTPGKSGLQVSIVSFGFGCTDVSNVIPLTVRGTATAALTVISDDHCYQSPVEIKDVSTIGAGNSILSESWDFGDGQTSAQLGGTLTHTYANPGNYPVRLTVRDAAGCSVSSTVSYVSVNGPLAAFTPSGTDVNLNSTVYFYNNSNTYGSSNTVWSWDFGDGTTSTDYYPSHIYTTPGTYVVKMTAKDASSPNTCITSAPATIVVKNFNSHFSTFTTFVTTGSCPPVLAQFVNTSVNYSSVSWDFGDGVTAGYVNSPSHVYEKAGRYIVTLYVNDFNGVKHQYIDSVIVREGTADLSAADLTICVGEPAVLEGKAKGAKKYTWDFGDGTVSTSSYPDSVMKHDYTAGGNYATRLLVTDTFGCSTAATTAVDLRVHPLPVVAVSPAAPFICKDGSVILTATGGDTYSWSPATGLDRTDMASPVASPAANTAYTVLVKDDAGCQNTGGVTVTVVNPQTVSAQPDSTAVCLGDGFQITATGTDVYNWIGFIDGLPSATSSVQTARPSVSGVYTVVGSDSHACFTDTATVIVTVMPVPSVNAGPDVEVLAANPVLLAATGSADVISWVWSPKDYLSCVDCAQPVSSPRKPEQYIVMVKNSDGCSARDTVNARILCLESQVRIPEAFSPNGDGKNDRFVILGIGEVKHLVIYSRWGVKVWERNNFYPADSFNCWDGTMNGQPAPVGAYAYFVEMECPAGGVFGMRGTVVLVR